MKYIVITGAASGLGLALADHALQQGYTVFGTYRKTAPSEQLSVQYPTTFFPIHLDVTNEEMIVKAVEQLEKHLDGAALSVLINNAAFIEAKPVALCSSADLLRHFNTNVVGVFSMIKHFMPLLKSDQQNGRIVNINSVAGQLPLPFHGAYAVSKSGLTMLTNMLRLEQIPAEQIQMSDIWLGSMQTEVHERNAKNAEDLSQTDYAEWAEKMKKRVTENYSKGFLPSVIAEKVFDILKKEKMRYNYLITQNRWKVKLLLLLGNRPLIYRLIRGAYFG